MLRSGGLPDEPAAWHSDSRLVAVIRLTVDATAIKRQAARWSLVFMPETGVDD